MTDSTAVCLPKARDEARAALENEIVELWGHISAATYRFLELVAELDRTEAWGHWGVASCAQWLNLKCGIGPGAAREKVRVARALERLPKISAAFRTGRISYSKVRAMTRVATPAMEDTLLNTALYGTATHVERLVRAFRKVERLEDAGRAEHSHRNRYLQFRYDDEHTVAVHGRLPIEVAELVKQAIEVAMATLDEVDDAAARNETRVPAGTCATDEDVGES